MKLAQRLAAIHGPVRVAAESSGLHLYLASPACLEEDGLIELTKKHLAVNVDKWFRGEEWCALCMKTETPYSVNDLVSMQSLEARGYQDVQREVTVQAKDNAAFLEDDGRGHMVPKSPGVRFMSDGSFARSRGTTLWFRSTGRAKRPKMGNDRALAQMLGLPRRVTRYREGEGQVCGKP